MSGKYIRRDKNSFKIIRNSKNYGRFSSLEDAIFIRDELADNNWDLGSIRPLYLIDDDYTIVSVLDGKVHVIAKFKKVPSQERIDSLIKKHKRNPNNSRYGLNITRIFETFVIKKQIAGDEYIFGYYDNLADAEFVRNFLMDNNWNVHAFSQIEYDEDEDRYKVIEVIDDKVYVLDASKDKIDLDKVHEEFLNKIQKHRLGLASHPYLDELKDSIGELEEKFSITLTDENWQLRQTSDPLNDIIFKLTPFQQSVYDAVGNSTFEEIKQSLIRFKSKNFDKKIQKNLDELQKMGLITKDDDRYIK